MAPCGRSRQEARVAGEGGAREGSSVRAETVSVLCLAGGRCTVSIG